MAIIATSYVESEHRPFHLGKYLMNRGTTIDIEPFAAWDVELAGVEPQQVQHGGVDVGYVVGALDGVKP